MGVGDGVGGWWCGVEVGTSKFDNLGVLTVNYGFVLFWRFGKDHA